MAKRLMALIHVNCRKTAPVPYIQGSSQMRLAVPDDKVPWDVTWPEYKPDDFTMPLVLDGPVWADPNIRVVENTLKFNTIDGKVDRRSFTGQYKLDQEGTPLNPVGRTGLKGRGILGKWGPNHAADPIVTRWKRDENGAIVNHPSTKAPVLQFVAILRQDTGMWAVPGGMVDPGENVSVTLRREFGEEAMNTLEMSGDEIVKVKRQVDQLFSHGVKVFSGYVDDPRNTDNAWMETVAYNFHDGDGGSVGSFKLHAGDDAVGVKWVDIDKDLKLYASHLDLVKKVAELQGAHW